MSSPAPAFDVQLFRRFQRRQRDPDNRVAIVTKDHACATDHMATNRGIRWRKIRVDKRLRHATFDVARRKTGQYRRSRGSVIAAKQVVYQPRFLNDFQRPAAGSVPVRVRSGEIIEPPFSLVSNKPHAPDRQKHPVCRQLRQVVSRCILAVQHLT